MLLSGTISIKKQTRCWKEVAVIFSSSVSLTGRILHSVFCLYFVSYYMLPLTGKAMILLFKISKFLYLFCIVHPLFNSVSDILLWCHLVWESQKFLYVTVRNDLFNDYMMGISSWYYWYPVNIKNIYLRVNISRTIEYLRYWLFGYI